MNRECPGCGETYNPDLVGEPVILDFRPLGLDRQEPVIAIEEFTAPDGAVYCSDLCFEENGK